MTESIIFFLRSRLSDRKAFDKNPAPRLAGQSWRVGKLGDLAIPAQATSIRYRPLVGPSGKWISSDWSRPGAADLYASAPIARFAKVFYILSLPLVGNPVTEFRPDIFWGMLCGIGNLPDAKSWVSVQSRIHLCASGRCWFGLARKTKRVAGNGRTHAICRVIGDVAAKAAPIVMELHRHICFAPIRDDRATLRHQRSDVPRYDIELPCIYSVACATRCS